MNRDNARLPALARYGSASQRAADQIIRSYSTSFGAATRLLGSRHRQHIRNIYALVRVADELVDGVAAQAHLKLQTQSALLDALEQETNTAITCGYSSNPIVHAFAVTARLAGIDATLTEPFFASMRMDLPSAASSAPTNDVLRFDGEAHADYVYGSAEVVGLMCLRVFVRDEAVTPDQTIALERGARSLGAAFQNVNFLRDLADDTERLERSYLSDGRPMTEQLKNQWVATIRAQLEDARTVIPLLPADARVAVDCARRLFSALTEKLAITPVDRLMRQRVRVSNPRKAVLVAAAIIAKKRGSTP